MTPLSVWAMNFSMMIGLAVGIDYSLFIVTRYREERHDGRDALDAIGGTLSTAGKAVFLSALTVVLSLAAVFFVPIMVFRSMALGMILSVVAVALASLTLLPAVLVALGDRVLLTRGNKDPGHSAESLARTVPNARVGGPAAQNHDLTAVLTGRAPLAIAVIMIVAFVLLLVVFRSLTIAISSILLNLVGVGAAFGFATLVFQHGVGASLIGIQPQGFVDAWAPLFFFALLFGLSMDYQLFLLAAIKERYDATGDAQLAVRDGIARTGRPITNAALIMIVVFVAFGVTGPIPPTELGITLALAVLLDATVIRMMLVPAIMGLLGERSWWLPAVLDRHLPVVRFSH